MGTNKTRMRDSKILIGAALLTALLSKPAITPGSGPAETMEVLGFILIASCAIGRIYSTLFIGGIKSEKLVTIGPYSMCRNPLYFFSLLGAAGIGMLSGELSLFVFLTGGFIFIYHSLIQREEEFLSQKFGSEFTTFCATTPRLMPDIHKYAAPEEVTLQTLFVNKAVRDATWWFVALPVFEIIGYVHDKDILKPLFTLI